jgi:hypothetical protein
MFAMLVLAKCRSFLAMPIAFAVALLAQFKRQLA